MCKRSLTIVLIAATTVIGMSLALARSAFASGGCVDSPENPTLLLALLGAGAAGLAWWRGRRRARSARRGWRRGRSAVTHRDLVQQSR